MSFARRRIVIGQTDTAGGGAARRRVTAAAAFAVNLRHLVAATCRQIRFLFRDQMVVGMVMMRLLLLLLAVIGPLVFGRLLQLR